MSAASNKWQKIERWKFHDKKLQVGVSGLYIYTPSGGSCDASFKKPRIY